MKKLLIIFPLVIGFMVLAFLAAELRTSIDPGLTDGQPNVIAGGKAIKVEIADEAEEHWRGLSNKPSLDREEGMLFIFGRKQVRSFWMKDMNFPIDIIWMDGNEIVNITKNAQPEGSTPERTYSSIYPVNFVLEVNAGLSDELGLKRGDKVIINY